MSVFLRGRLAEIDILEWALKLAPHQLVQRNAVLDALEHLDERAFKEPWRTAWRLVEESWSDDDPSPGPPLDAYRAQRRIVAGERTGSLIATIGAAVRPRLHVDARRKLALIAARPRHPRRVEQLVWASLTSHPLVPENVYRLETIRDTAFLAALGTELEGAVNRGLSIARRFGWKGDHVLWPLGQLYSVSYRNDDDDGVHDSDEYHRGIAPSVKLLDAVLAQLSAVDPEAVRQFIAGWRQGPTPIHQRLWASRARDRAVVSEEEFSGVMSDLSDRAFWDVHAFPEFAELRASRFGDLVEPVRRAVETRLRKGPPKSLWPKEVEAVQLQRARTYASLRELRRVQVAGHPLSEATAAWVVERLGNFNDLRDMASALFGLPGARVVRDLLPQTDERYGALRGLERLQALEEALATSSRTWNDDPAEAAGHWIRQGDHAAHLLADLHALGDGAAAFPQTVDRVGWSLKAPEREHALDPQALELGEQGLTLLARLPEATLRASIEGVSHWISSWAHVIARSERLETVWVKLWPLAVAATNDAGGDWGNDALHEIAVPAPADAPRELDTLNQPVGRLIGVFMARCPSFNVAERPFERDELLRRMRDDIAQAEGKAGVIGLHHLVEHLPYFLSADEAWARATLIVPLSGNDHRAVALWQALARRTLFHNVLKIIGDEVADRVLDPQIGRDWRERLLSSLLIESLHALREARPPAVSESKVQQTLRSVEDEVRASAAQTVQRYLRSMSEVRANRESISAESIFHDAVAPFLNRVWPQERSMATPGVSKAFADVPAHSGEAFADAVGAIAAFVVPFDCWSMLDFGLWGDVEGAPRLSMVNNAAKAAAFLRLLDLSIGASDTAIVPMDLADALDQIRRASSSSTGSPAFRRLAAVAARRQ